MSINLDISRSHSPQGACSQRICCGPPAGKRTTPQHRSHKPKRCPSSETLPPSPMQWIAELFAIWYQQRWLLQKHMANSVEMPRKTLIFIDFGEIALNWVYSPSIRSISFLLHPLSSQATCIKPSKVSWSPKIAKTLIAAVVQPISNPSFANVVRAVGLISNK